MTLPLLQLALSVGHSIIVEDEYLRHTCTEWRDKETGCTICPFYLWNFPENTHNCILTAHDQLDEKATLFIRTNHPELLV